ncbi:MAG: hypothetical protein WB992_25740 [Bryobacteraceae bacterium]
MAKGPLSKRALDALNRASEIKGEIDFCGKDGRLPIEMHHFMGWLGDHLRSELHRDDWEEPYVTNAEDGVILYLYSPTWQLRADQFVAFSFWWPNLFKDPPCVQLYIPAEDLFPPRNELLNRLRPKLKRSGFTDYYEQGDPDPSCPIWKNIRLEEFHRESGFDLDSFVGAIVNGFRQLLEVEQPIEDACRSLPEKPLAHPSERELETIAFLDTECEGSGTARRMTQLAILSVAYDREGDAVIGILEKYFMDTGEALDESKARGALERADFIVAHNAFSADRPLLARHLPGTEKMRWLCSLRGIEWKPLLGIQSESLETLMGKAGLRYEQDHNALADARDLKCLLALKHKGRTYLGRLLDNTRTEGTSRSSCASGN